MILFKCATFVQLMNAIQIKRTMFADVDADIVFSKITDFSGIVDNVKACGVFRNVFETDDTLQWNAQFKTLPQKERERLTLHPDELFKGIDFGTYTELFLGVPYPSDILLYYHLINHGSSLKVNFYEEAQITYLLDWNKKVASSKINHDLYKEKRFTANRGKCYLYEPDMYVGNGFGHLTVQIPKIDCDEETKALYNSVFGYCEFPPEKYIFLEENFIGDGNAVTDIDCLDELAEYVGKDNIIVKMHPRSPHDRFSHRGYKLFPQSTLPLEMFVLNSDISDKVLVTISSGSGVSPSVMFSKKVYSLNLFKYMLIGKNFHVREPNFNLYFNKLMKTINKDSVSIFCPANGEAFRESIIYIEGGLANNG